MPPIRGKINNRARAKQLRDFRGLLFGNITPTDIDGHIEYHDKGHIFIETKLNDTPLPYGQRLALERLIDDLNKIKPSIGIIASHNEDDPNQDINVANTIVSEFRWKGKWHKPDSEYNTRILIERFIKHMEKVP